MKRTFLKITVGANVLFSVLLAMALLLMVNYLSFRHFRRVDVSRARFYSLSEATKEMMQGITNDINIIVFFQSSQAVFQDIDTILKEYEATSPNIRVERVDPDRNLARAEELAKTYHVDQANVVVFASGERSKYLTAEDIFDFDMTPLRQGAMPVKKAFKGEQAFSSAIMDLTGGQLPVVYFLSGHGEGDLDSFDRRVGYSKLAEFIKRDSVRLKKLTAGEYTEIPEDCSALVILAPSSEISQAEINMIQAYLEKKGRVMILADAIQNTGLNSLLQPWGIALRESVVVDPSRTLTGRELFVSDYGKHAITRGLKDITSVFYLPAMLESVSREVVSGDPVDKPRVSVIVAGGTDSWAEMNLEQTPMTYDPDIDIKGPVALGVAVEKGMLPGFDVQIPPTRMVVFSDADFVSNAGMTGGNPQLFMNALNWLLERESALDIPAKPYQEISLSFTRGQYRLLLIIVTVAIPLVVAAMGVLVWLRRRVG